MGAVALVGALAGCERAVILSGQRFDTRTPLDQALAAGEGQTVADQRAEVNRAVPVALGAPVSNAEWGHRGGSASHAMPHVALSGAPRPIWSASIGTGENSRRRMATAPVVGGGRVFAMDALNRLTALSTANGGQIWTLDVTLPGERRESAGGGGLAYADGRLLVSTGFGELISVDPATGGVRWRQRFEAPVSGAPAIAGGSVYVAGRDGAGCAVDVATGKQQWFRPGVRQMSAVQGGIAPAVGDGRVVMPYSSGQLIALDRSSGTPVWQGAVVGQRPGRAVANLSDLTGDPVISGGRIYAGASSGVTSAFRADTGETIWEAREGSMNPVWPVGNAVFLVSDEGRLLRLDAATGETVWAAPLGHYAEDRVKRQRATIAHYGPVLAGGRLVVASSDRMLRFYSPENGALLNTVQMPAGAVSAPAVAAGTLFVVTDNGQVQAFR